MMPFQAMRLRSELAGGGGVLFSKISSWWEMDESTGTRADSKGSNHLSVSGSVGTAAGSRGSDVAAAMTGGFLGAVSDATLQVPAGGGDYCFFGWAYFDSNGGVQFAAAKWDAAGSAGLEYAISQQGGTLYGQTGGAGYVNVSTSPPSSGAWHMYVFWRDGSDGLTRLQIDDGSIYVSGGVATPSPSLSPLNFGAGAGSYTMSGRLQRWGWIKGDVLTPTERTWLYNSGLGRTWAELVASGV